MAVPVIETFAVTNMMGTSQALTAPSGIVENDMILMVIALDGIGSNLLSTDFTNVDNPQEATACETFWLIKRATASEPGTYTATWTGNERGRAQLFRISGVVTTGSALDQVDVIGTQDDAASGTAIFCPAITSTVIDTLAIATVTVDGLGVVGGDGFNTANGFVVEGTSGNNGSLAAGGIVGSKDLPSIGSSLSPEFSWTTSEQHVTNMINLIGISAAAGFAHSQAVIIG